MDFNEDRWGSVSKNSDTLVEGGTMTKDVLENNIGDNVEEGESSRVYFQNIGIVLFLKSIK